MNGQSPIGSLDSVGTPPTVATMPINKYFCNLMNAIGVKAGADGFPAVGGTNEVTQFGKYDDTNFSTRARPRRSRTRESTRSFALRSPTFLSSMNRSAHILVATLSSFVLLASSDGCALQPDEGIGPTGGARTGRGGSAAPDGGPSSGASGLGGAGGKASTDGGGTSGRDAHGGDMQTGGAAGADSGGGSPYANFATVREIVLFKCGGAGCHSGEREPRLVDEAKLYSTLTTYVSPRCSSRVLVKPGSPEESAFYLAQKGLCGTNLPQMPLGCIDNCTPSDYLEGVRQWIANGASQQ